MREQCGISGLVGRLSGRYSKNSIFGATQNATRALPGHLIMGRSVIGAYANRPGGSAMGLLRAPARGVPASAPARRHGSPACAVNQSMISPPVAFHTPAWA